MSGLEGTNLEDFSMLDLFKLEVETHAATLNNGLLEMEHSGDGRSADLEALMRAAHSIKGGARIVEIDAAVRVAHALEDCFVALQERGGRLSAEAIDRLLHAVDILTQLAERAQTGEATDDAIINRVVEAVRSVHEGEGAVGTASPAPSRTDATEATEPPKAAEGGHAVAESEPPPSETSIISALPPDTGGASAPAEDDSVAVTDTAPFSSPPAVAQRHPSPPPPSQILSPQPADVATPSAGTPGEADALPQSSETAQSDSGRILRVTAGKLERLMGLAGEVVVGSRWLTPFLESLVLLKRHQNKLSEILDTLQKELEETAGKERAASLVTRARKAAKACNQRLAEQLDHLDGFTSRTTHLSDRLYNEMIGIRMCPFSEGVRGYARMVRDLARELGKSARLEIEGLSTEVDRDILEKLDTALAHLLRNAVDHGIEPPDERRAAGKPETGLIRLCAMHRAGMLLVTVSDDGRGIDPETLRRTILEKRVAPRDIAERLTEPELMEFLFLPKFTTAEAVTEISGRGVGLDAVRSAVHDVGGVVRAFAALGRGITFQMELPLTLSVIRTFLVEISGEPYAFPLARIDRCLCLPPEEIHLAEGRQYFQQNGSNIALIDSHEILDLEPVGGAGGDNFNIVVISDQVHGYGLMVDRFLGECDLVVRPLDPRLGKIPDVSAAAIMLDGSPVLIFDVEDMINSITKLLEGRGRLNRVKATEAGEDVRPPQRILVVEDSFVVREKERRLLESKGYDVDVAVDGMDGWNLLRTNTYDMVLSDIDMPRMNGIELVRQIRASLKLKKLPVIIVSYKSSEEDRLLGLEAGANYYLPKTDFDDTKLINAVIDLIGEP